MKKWIALWSLFTVAAALAFVNNIAVIVRWWMAFIDVGGDSSQMPATCPGIIPGFDWSAVDYSAVSTFIPLLGCIFVVRGLIGIARGKVQSSEAFPFFPSIDQFNVALGLFGTLWGIIVIGYFRLDKVSMGDLMHCLHTALFSTLVAVVWVFMIDHPLIRPWMRKLLLGANLVKTEGAPLADAVDALVTRLAAASEAFDRRQREYEEAIAKRQCEYEAANEKRRAAYEADFNDRQQRVEAAFIKRLQDAELAFAKREKETADAFAARLAELQVANESARAQFTAQLEEERRRHQASEAEERERNRQTEDAMAATVAQSRTAEAKADEARRAAEAKAEAANVRAESAESKLESARAALRI